MLLPLLFQTHVTFYSLKKLRSFLIWQSCLLPLWLQKKKKRFLQIRCGNFLFFYVPSFFPRETLRKEQQKKNVSKCLECHNVAGCRKIFKSAKWNIFFNIFYLTSTNNGSQIFLRDREILFCRQYLHVVICIVVDAVFILLSILEGEIIFKENFWFFWKEFSQYFLWHWHFVSFKNL